MNAPTGVAERLTGLVGALRAHGVRIGTGETVDAAQAVAALGLTDRELLREGLAATLLHSTGQRRVFDPVFDLYFPRLVGAPMPEGRRATLPPPTGRSCATGSRPRSPRATGSCWSGSRSRRWTVSGATVRRRGRTAGRRTRRSTGSARRR